MIDPPGGRGLLVRGLAAGLASGGFNLLYFFVYVAVTGLSAPEPTWASVAVSSLVPCVLGALGYAWLARRSVRADAYFALCVGAIVALSFEGLFHSRLPDGSLKPPGFDGLVMPMHVIVGLAAVLFIPRWARLRLPCVRWE